MRRSVDSPLRRVDSRAPGRYSPWATGSGVLEATRRKAPRMELSVVHSFIFLQKHCFGHFTLRGPAHAAIASVDGLASASRHTRASSSTSYRQPTWTSSSAPIPLVVSAS